MRSPGIEPPANGRLFGYTTLAWYASHQHTIEGLNQPYQYSYLFAYPIEIAKEGTKTLKLPNNEKIRILAISVADENPELTPAQPLYDDLNRAASKSVSTNSAD